MAIAFVGGNTATKAGATSGTSTIALNSGLTGGSRSSVQQGDLVIAVFGTGSTSNRTLSITDGTTDYTLIGSELYANSGSDIDTNLRVAYKFMGSTPDTSTTFGPTGSTSDAGAMAVYVFSGVNQTTPLDVTVTTATGVSSSTANPPSITPSTAGSFIVCVGASGHDIGVDTYTAPGDLVDFLTAGSNDTNDVSVGVGHKDDWASGAFNAANWVCVTGSGKASWAAMSIALRKAPNAFSVTADSGSYAVTGTAATFRRTYKLIADTSSYAITGTASSLEYGREVLALSGSYTISGTDASLEFGREVAALSGVYTVTGTDASLEFGREVLADGGFYAVTGTDASLEVGREVLADGGSYAITGATASLFHGWEIAADGGTYAVTGTDATLTKAGGNKSIAADAGSYALTGTVASLEYGREALALAGSYTVSGTDASLEYGREVLALSGSYTVTGTDATLTKAGAKSLIADGGTYAITGTAATLVYTPAAGQVTPPPRYGGGGAPIWSEVSWFKKKKPKKEELVEEVAEVVEQAIPQVTPDDSRAVAQRIVRQLGIEQLRKIQTLEAFILRVEAELAEMDDEEVLLLAA